MMYLREEAVDGMEYALWEVDQEIASHIPELKKRKCTPRVMEEVDALLDTRNYLIDIMGEIVIDEYERMMTNG